MSFLNKFVTNFNRALVMSQHRTISISPVNRLKEIIKKQEGDTLIIEGRFVEHPKEKLLLKPNSNGACTLCSAGVYLRHTDVKILSQFLRSNGTIMPRRITGLCWTQQKRLNKLVAMSQKAGLMPNINPINSHRDPKKRRGVKAFNVWYDEETIEAKFYGAEYR